MWSKPISKRHLSTCGLKLSMCLSAVLDHTHCKIKACACGDCWVKVSSGTKCHLQHHGRTYWTHVQRQGITPVGAEASRILGHIHHQKTQAYTTALCSQILVRVPGRHMKEEERDTWRHILPFLRVRIYHRVFICNQKHDRRVGLGENSSEEIV